MLTVLVIMLDLEVGHDNYAGIDILPCFLFGTNEIKELFA